jgi:hypothetical protein
MTKFAMLAVVGLALGAIVRAQDGQLRGALDDHGLVPKAPIELVYARPYEVEKAMDFIVDGKVEKVKKGYVLVLKADLKLLEPKDVPDFALFADRAIGQRVNSGYRDGYVVVITPAIDLAKAPIWFGSRLVPDRVTAPIVESERAAATGRGIQPFAADKIAAALKLGGDTLHAKDLNELWYEQKPLIIKYAPAEREMAESLRK